MDWFADVNWGKFAYALSTFLGVIALQLVSAFADSTLTPGQLRELHVYDRYAATEHGGVRYDIVLSFVLALAYAKHDFHFWSLHGVASFVICAALVYLALKFFESTGLKDHCTDGQKTVLAGWLHGLYALMALWTMEQLYLRGTTPVASHAEMAFYAMMFTPWCYYGIAKFSDRWVFSAGDKMAVAGGVTVIWILWFIRVLKL